MDPLAKLSAATAALAEARTLPEVKAIKDTAIAAQAYARAKGLGEEAEQYAAEIRLEAARRMGQVLQQAKDTGELRTTGNPQWSQSGTIGLSDIGISKNESAAAQTLAAVPDDDWEPIKQDALANGVRTERKMAEIIKLPHVANNSGNNEWYTPREFTSAARAVMGDIDLDPASSAEANQVVCAAKFFTADDDGLSHAWRGRVWMNPPYASGLINRFAEKLVKHFAAGDVVQAICLVNNATETGWFGALILHASAVVFPNSRIRFWKPGGEVGAPLQGQAIIYLGPEPDQFIEQFGTFGWAAWISR